MKTELNVMSEVKNLVNINELLEDCFLKENVPMKIQFKLFLAVEELFSNICNYAYNKEPGEVFILCSIENGQVQITLTDSGEPFDPTAKEDPDITVEAEKRPIGGLGIFMVKNNVDNLDYSYSDNKNKVTITKSF